MKLETPRPEKLLLAGCLLFALTMCLGPVSNPDMPWHLAVGRRIVAERAVPRTDFLSWTTAGKPWVDFEWLTQILFHALDRAGGAAGLWAFKVVSFSALALLFAALLSLWGLSEAWVGLSVCALVAALRLFLQPRPENFSLLFFMLQLLVLEARRLERLKLPDGALLVGHLALYALWANLHAGFPVGLLLCACYGLAERWSAGPSRRASPLAWAAAAAAGTCLNPYGARVYSVLWAHWTDLSSLQYLINEWGAPKLGNLYLSGYWILLLFALAGFLVSVAQGVRVPPEHVLVAVVFGVFASRALRTTGYVTLVLFPLGLLAWSRLVSPAWWKRARPWVLGGVVFVAAWSAASAMRRDGFLRGVKSETDLEIAPAAAFLRSEKATLGGLKLFNPYNWGGYIDNTLYPDYRVFMDGRYLFAGLLKETDEADKNPPRWTKFMDKYGVELALMMNTGRIVSFRGQTSWRSFEAYALPRSDWALVYWDRQALIFVRRSKAPAAWIKEHEFEHIRPHDLRYVGLRILSGWESLSAVSAEIDRYRRDIGDPFESLVLANWLDNFKRGLDETAAIKAKGARKGPRRDSSKSAPPRP